MAKGNRPTDGRISNVSLYKNVEEILNSDSGTKLKRRTQANTYIHQFASQQGIPESSVKTVDDLAKHIVYDAIDRNTNVIIQSSLDKKRAELPSSFKRGGDTFVKLPGWFSSKFAYVEPGQRALEHTYTPVVDTIFRAAGKGLSRGGGSNAKLYEVNGMSLVYSGNDTYKIVKNNKKAKKK